MYKALEVEFIVSRKMLFVTTKWGKAWKCENYKDSFRLDGVIVDLKRVVLLNVNSLLFYYFKLETTGGVIQNMETIYWTIKEQGWFRMEKINTNYKQRTRKI